MTYDILLEKRLEFVGMGWGSKNALGIGMESGENCFGIGHWDWDGENGVEPTLWWM